MFNRKKNYMSYGKFEETIHSSFLAIGAYPSQLTERVLNDIYGFNVDFSVYQSFAPFSDEAAKSKLASEERKLVNNNNIYELEDLIMLQDEIQTGKMTLATHFFCLEIKAKNLDDLERDTQLIKTTIEKHGLKLFRETVNIEPLFWSRFPTLEYLNKRARDITSANAADLVTFAKIGEGFGSNAFGDRPITHFKTNLNSLFAFNLHNSPSTKEDTLGHTLVIGGSGSGKTVLSAFIAANNQH
jgi:type IV secretion system protein VirB4/ComB4 competence protein